MISSDLAALSLNKKHVQSTTLVSKGPRITGHASNSVLEMLSLQSAAHSHWTTDKTQRDAEQVW